MNLNTESKFPLPTPAKKPPRYNNHKKTIKAHASDQNNGIPVVSNY